MLKPRGKFITRRVGHIIEVWIPPVGHPEGELVCAIDQSLLPALIAALKAEKHLS